MMNRPPRRRRNLASALLLSAGFALLILLSASTARAQTGAWKRIESEYVAHYWRYGALRTFRDHGDLLHLRKQLYEKVDPKLLGKDAYTEYLCLRLLIERAIAGVRIFERLEKDPGMILPTGDVFHRALQLPDGEASETGPARRIARYFKALSEALERAPSRWRELDKRHVASALRRAGGLHRQLREGFLLLEKNLPGEQKEAWTARGSRLLASLESYRTRLKAWKDRLPDPTEEAERNHRKKLLDFRLRYDYLLDEDSDALLRRAARFFIETKRELEAQARRIDSGKTWQEILLEGERDHPKRGGILALAERSAAEAMRFVIEKDLVTVPDWARHFQVVPGNPEGAAPFAQYRPARGKREGAFVAVPCGGKWDAEKAEAHLRANNRHWMRAVALHEAVPGHHLQFSIASRLDKTVRRFFHCTAYVEGWALHCEEMMGQNGFFEPTGRVNQLRMKLWRAVRVLDSVGMNHRGLSRERAVAFLREQLLFKEMHAKKEVEMHRRRPAYFCGYSIGFWQIQALRERLRRDWGSSFTEKRFHDAFLSVGPIPVPLVEKVLTRKATPE